jgi:hypothetical protein
VRSSATSPKMALPARVPGRVPPDRGCPRVLLCRYLAHYSLSQYVLRAYARYVYLTEGNARAAVLGTGTVGDATVGRSIFGRNFTPSIEKKF